jgi:hypothetical protein
MITLWKIAARSSHANTTAVKVKVVWTAVTENKNQFLFSKNRDSCFQFRRGFARDPLRTQPCQQQTASTIQFIIMSCNYQVKTLKGQLETLSDIPLNITVRELYQLVEPLESTPNGKWKLMLLPSVRTLKPSTDLDKEMKEHYGVQEGYEYRLEVILDMGACHTTCKRF